MATSNNDYLRFSAYSIKELITRKLSDDSKFTDQIYEGSNLAILIDIVSYMYQCLLYNVNSAASESMWADTQIYENINRLCKFIGYNPKGYGTATCIFTLDNSTKKYSLTNIPSYSYIDTKKTDKQGKKIFYSTTSMCTVNAGDDKYDVILSNGRWKLYSTIFTSNGDAYQTFTLDGIYSDSDRGTKSKYVPSDMIHVYVDENPTESPSAHTISRWEIAKQGIFTDNRVENGVQIYNQTDNIYDVRLNEDKTYQIMFGNNFNGHIPKSGSLIYVFYLDSNGEAGQISLNDVKNAKMQHSADGFGMSPELYAAMFKNEFSGYGEDATVQGTTQYLFANGTWSNTRNSSGVAEEETVEEIRHNAPQWFKLGNRLITASDWEYFIKNIFRKNNIIDVKCQNNWAYISTFYNWLYNIGVEQKQNGRYYLTQSKVSKYAKFSDAADTNNVYLWIKMKDDADIYNDIFDKEVQDVKALTQEPVYLKPLNVCFCISAQETELARKMWFNDANDNNDFDPDCKSYLELTVDDNSVYSTTDIYNQAIACIKEFFNEDNFKLGQVVDYSKLSEKILEIHGISRIRTIYYNPDDEYQQQRIINGISFATWTESFIDLGDDLDISNTSRSLEVFQFPKLYMPGKLSNRIKIIKKSISTINTIQY